MTAAWPARTGSPGARNRNRRAAACALLLLFAALVPAGAEPDRLATSNLPAAAHTKILRPRRAEPTPGRHPADIAFVKCLRDYEGERTSLRTRQVSASDVEEVLAIQRRIEWLHTEREILLLALQLERAQSKGHARRAEALRAAIERTRELQARAGAGTAARADR
jgi:hypothetical protein